MQYMGGKSRCAKWLREHITPLAVGCHTYLEPFLGGANSFVALSSLCPTRYTSDADENVVVLWKAVSRGWHPPNAISRERYVELRTQVYPSPLKSFVGFGCSFGGKWFGGYAANARGRNYCGTAARSIEAARGVFAGTEVLLASYEEWGVDVGPGWLVYCDPPYQGTQGYGRGFDSPRFWAVMRAWASRGAVVVVSEYAAPDDFTLVADKVSQRSLSAQGSNRQYTVERLWTPPAPPPSLVASK